VYEATRVLSEFYRQLSGERYLTFNPGLALGGTAVRVDSTGVAGAAEGKANVVAEHMTVVGDLRTISPEQLARAKQMMQAIVATHLPNTSAELTFDAGYPPMAPTAGNRRLLTLYDRVSRDLGLWPVTAVDPSKAGAADVSFVADLVPMKIDGVGLSGHDDHTTKETADLRMLPVQTKRAALLLYRLSIKTPEASDRLAVVATEARAREVTDYRARQKRETRVTGMRGSLEQMMSQLKSSGRKEFPLVIKGDVQGSIEAILGSLDKLGTEEVIARVIHAGVGGITESDVTLAEASGAAIIGFNVRAHKEARELAERSGTEIRYYNIIYDLVDDVKKAMSGLLAPTIRETTLGTAEILEVFNISKVGKIAGSRVTDGTVERGAQVRLIRDNVVIHEGKLSQLKRFKDDAREVTAGQECGIAFESFQDMRAGDIIECYRVETVQRSL